MKRTVLVITAAITLSALVGCYTPRQYPLQPGEKIIMETQDRANEFRRLSGNDMSNTGSVVNITKPTAVSCE